MTKKAIWNGIVIAESNDLKNVEGNYYFPKEDIHMEYFESSDTQTHCHWKGAASYYHIKVDGAVNKDAAWFYPNPKEAASHIKGRIAFWRGVEVVDA